VIEAAIKMHALLQRLPLRFLWYACAPLTLIYAGPPQASCGSVCLNPSADMVLLQRQTTVDRVDQKNTLTVQCVDMPLSGAWGGGGAYTCKTFEIYGTAYCAHEVINKACCICGGGKTASSPSPNKSYTATCHNTCHTCANLHAHACTNTQSKSPIANTEADEHFYTGTATSSIPCLHSAVGTHVYQ